MKTFMQLAKYTVAITLTLAALNVSAGGLAKQPYRGAHPLASGSVTNNISETQKQNIQQLLEDLAAMKAGWHVTQAEWLALASDLKAIAATATRPDPALVEKFGNDLDAAIEDGKLTNLEKAVLLQDFVALCESANVAPELVEQAIADAKVIIYATGFTADELEQIADDLKAIVAEFHANHPNWPVWRAVE